MNASILKAGSILRRLCEGRNRLRDISKDLQLNKSSVYRLLQALSECGTVVQDPISRQYYLGPLVLNLSSQPILNHQSLIVSAFNEMVGLRNRTKETINLHVRMGLERMCLEEIQSAEKERIAAEEHISRLSIILDELKKQMFAGNISIEYENNWDHSVPDIA